MGGIFTCSTTRGHWGKTGGKAWSRPGLAELIFQRQVSHHSLAGQLCSDTFAACFFVLHLTLTRRERFKLLSRHTRA